MYRRAQIFLVSSALIFGLIAVVTAQIVDKRMLDPEGFLGPSWLRLPLLVGAALLVDLVPRTLWKSKFKWKDMGPIFKERVRTHWTRERLTLVALGIVCFYLVYVCYRNLKSFLPFVVPETYEFDHELHLIDKAVLFGADPAIVLHDLLGTGWAAWFLSYIYMWFLPLVPFAVAGWLVWSRNLAYGYWFVSSQCIAWILGTVSYYCLPTVGPGLQYPYLRRSATPASTLMESLVFTGNTSSSSTCDANVVQWVGGFASLHTGITLLVALMIPGHDQQQDRPLGRLDQLRDHRRRDRLLRLALPRRRRRGRDDRARRLLLRRARGRPEVPAQRRAAARRGVRRDRRPRGEGRPRADLIRA